LVSKIKKRLEDTDEWTWNKGMVANSRHYPGVNLRESTKILTLFNTRKETDPVSDALFSLEYRTVDKVHRASNPEHNNFQNLTAVIQSAKLEHFHLSCSSLLLLKCQASAKSEPDILLISIF
jgi:hypothetical protein